MGVVVEVVEDRVVAPPHQVGPGAGGGGGIGITAQRSGHGRQRIGVVGVEVGDGARGVRCDGVGCGGGVLRPGGGIHPAVTSDPAHPLHIEHPQREIAVVDVVLGGGHRIQVRLPGGVEVRTGTTALVVRNDHPLTALLRDLVFQPWQRRAEAPRRRQMLRMLTEGRPHVLAAEAARAALSLRVQAALERRAKPSAR